LDFSDWISLIRRIRVIRGAEGQSGLLFNHKTGARDGFQRKRDAPHLAKFTLIRSTEFLPPRTWIVVELEISRLNEIRWWYGGFVLDFSDYSVEIDDFVSEKSISFL